MKIRFRNIAERIQGRFNISRPKNPTVDTESDTRKGIFPFHPQMKLSVIDGKDGSDWSDSVTEDNRSEEEIRRQNYLNSIEKKKNRRYPS